MPASARNSVDLPLPDGPLSSTLSPGPACSDTPLSSVAPVGRFKRQVVDGQRVGGQGIRVIRY